MERVRTAIAAYDGPIKKDRKLPEAIQQSAIYAAGQALEKPYDWPGSREQNKCNQTQPMSLLSLLEIASAKRSFSSAAKTSEPYQELDQLLIRFIAMGRKVNIEIDERAFPQIATELLRERQMNVETLDISSKDVDRLTLYRGDALAEAVKQERFPGVSLAVIQQAVKRRPCDPEGLLNQNSGVKAKARAPDGEDMVLNNP